MTSTTKNISDHPPAGTVTQPTDKNVKERDIQRKMKLISVIDAMRQGKMPTNKQIDENMQYVLSNSPIDTTQLSREGQELVGDVQSLIETARQIVMTKNADEVFQTFMWSARETDNSKINPANQVGAEVSKDQAKSEGQEAVQHLKTLGKLVLTNGEFRKVAKDLGTLARDVGADAAQKAADKSRPSEEARQNVDEPAGSHEWVSYEEGMAPINKTKEAAQKTKQAASNQKEQARSEAQATREDPDRQERVRQGIGALGAEVRDPNNQESLRQTAQDPEARANLQQDAKERAKERIPQEHQDKLRERRDRTKEYVQEKFPEERRERFIYRLKKIIIECQEQPDYQDSIAFFLDLAENYKVRADRQHSQVAEHGRNNVMSDPAFSSAFNNFRTLLERFANGQSMQPIFDATDNIYTDVNNDPELKKWFTSFGKYIRRVLQEPGFVMTDECDQQGRAFREDGKGFFSERYRPHREEWINATEGWFRAYADDPLNVQFGEDVKRLTKQLALDSDGKLTYKPNLWQDVRSVILPGLLDQIGYVPIPRIDYSDKQVDLVIENLTLESKNMLPNILELEATNHFKLSQHKEISNANRHNVVINFSQIQCDLKDVAFYYKKKTGFPKMSDNGLLDVLIGGEGLHGQIHLASSASKNRIFDVKDVTVKMHQAKINIHDAAKHGVLYSVFGPLANSVIKAAVPKAISQAIRNALEELDRQLVDINEQLEDAGRSEDQSKADVLKGMFQRKKDSGEAKGQQAKQTADKRDSQFKVVLREEDRILDWESKQSMVKRQGAAEREIKDQSDEWRSPIFDATTRPVRPAA